MIPYGRQDIQPEDIEAVVQVLKSDFLTQGTEVPRFEDALQKICNVSHALATNSATSALHLACLALGLGEGDTLWTTPITFVASANCGLYCGAKIDFVDIDPTTSNMDPISLAKKLEDATKHNTLPKVLVIVHMAGHPADMSQLSTLARQYGIRIIEDASHAIGAEIEGQPVGNCNYSDICVFSFHPVKIITTAEGGAALTNQEELASKMKLLRSHGITRDPSLMKRPTEASPWYYEQTELGFNYRMNDIQAALGRSQLNRLNSYVAKRNQIAKRYRQHLKHPAIKHPTVLPNTLSSWHLYVIRIDFSNTNRSQLASFEYFIDRGIGVNLHYIPVHTQPYYSKLGFRNGDFPNAEKYYREALTLPIYPTMEVKEQDSIIKAVCDLLSAR